MFEPSTTIYIPKIDETKQIMTRMLNPKIGEYSLSCSMNCSLFSAYSLFEIQWTDHCSICPFTVSWVHWPNLLFWQGFTSSRDIYLGHEMKERFVTNLAISEFELLFQISALGWCFLNKVELLSGIRLISNFKTCTSFHYKIQLISNFGSWMVLFEKKIVLLSGIPVNLLK